MTEVDSSWANRQSHPSADLRLLKDQRTELLPGLTAVICGGHFPGSLVLHSTPPNTTIPTLFVADTIFATQSGHNPDPGKRKDTISYQFLWSIPNFIPLPPDAVLQIWRALKPLEFKATYGVMAKVTNVCKFEMSLFYCFIGRPLM
jgi:glyoxylase-like metal-dependent hydrolase (beta-lactamase superfamily II)